MSEAPPGLPKWVWPVAAATAGLVSAMAVAGLLSVSRGESGHVPRRDVAGLIVVIAVAAPLLFDLSCLAAGLGGATVGAVVYCAALDPQAIGGAMAALLYVASWSLFAFGLSAALGRALGGPAAGRTAAVLVLVAAATTTFTTGRLLQGLEGSPGARRGIVSLTVAANPFLMANRALIVTSTGGGDYVPKQGRILYDLWIGTDFPFTYPSWWLVAVRWVLLGTALWLIAGFLPERLEKAEPVAAAG